MKKEDMQAALEAIGKGGIHVAGDLVLEKHVDYEVANVEDGGIGIQVNGKDNNVVESKRGYSGPLPTQDTDRNEELFHFINPSVDSTQEWRVHDEVKRLVKRQGIQEICAYLLQMRKDNKVLLPQSPSTAYAELVRMGMPNGEGFNENTFRKYYNCK